MRNHIPLPQRLQSTPTPAICRNSRDRANKTPSVTTLQTRRVVRGGPPPHGAQRRERPGNRKGRHGA